MFIIELLSMGIIYATVTTSAIYIMKSYYDSSDAEEKAEEKAEEIACLEELEVEEALEELKSLEEVDMYKVD